MKPPVFEYHQPDNVEEALALLGEAGDDAKVLAGGQSLVAMLNMRLTRPGQLVDINGIEGEHGLSVGRRSVRVGCLARHADFEDNPALDARLPVMGRAARNIAHVAIRNRGTFCGSLCHNDPAAEWPLMAALLDADMLVRSSTGRRKLAAGDFLLGYLTTALAPDEMLVGVELALPRGDWGCAFTEFSRRAGDFAIVSSAAMLEVRRGRIRAARLAVGGVDQTARRLAEVERLLQGETPSGSLWAEAGARARELVDPSSDLQATAEYRRHLVQRLTERVLAEAALEWKE